MEKEKLDRIIICWGLAFEILSLILILIGIHNIDTAFNMKPNEIDIGVNWSQRPMLEIYFSGIKMVLNGLWFSVIGFMLTFSISLLGSKPQKTNIT